MQSLMNWLPFKRHEGRVPVKRAASASDHPLANMRREMDHLFERFMKEPFGMDLWHHEPDRWFGDFSPGRFAPTIDIADEKAAVRITAELPGLEEKDVQVTLRGDAVVIRGEKKLEETSEDEGYYRAERSYGVFERAIPLPVEVDAEKLDAETIEAKFKNGVLTLRLPKSKEAAAPRQIPVKAE